MNIIHTAHVDGKYPGPVRIQQIARDAGVELSQVQHLVKFFGTDGPNANWKPSKNYLCGPVFGSMLYERLVAQA